MIETLLLLLYILIGFIVSSYVWKAYSEDIDKKKYILPKWLWRILIAVASLFWVVWLVVYLFKR